ncbi:hypothetical protein L5515_018529 [Caenorhabditis briggsae]|uniref:Uncharacterized protein n=1 Tax=Caenorhabditis briggsae TaxID=6238 RepID=A0AAE9FBP1_CAEBR|nr:hypothetical protein L5515_018529 [Caenorhabditis briggsae]
MPSGNRTGAVYEDYPIDAFHVVSRERNENLPNAKPFVYQKLTKRSVNMFFNGWVVFPNLMGSIALIIALHVYAREVPLNYVLLAAFTAVQALTMGCVVTLFEAKVVLEAAVITGIVVASLFAYTLQNKHDFSVGYGCMGSLLMVLLWAGIFQIFFMSPAMNFVINVFGAGLFCVLLVIDLDQIMYKFSPEDYICACVALYLDVLNLFIRILQIVAEANK